MMLLLSLFVLALAAVSPSDGQELKLQRGDCPVFWYRFNDRCYKYFASRMTWADAELQCLSEATNLVSIHSKEEHDFVSFLIKNHDHTQGPTWIGLTDIHKEGSWMWSDGCKYNFLKWDKGQPDNWKGSQHCGSTNYGQQFNWDDGSCVNKFPFVCASRKVCP